MIPSGTNSPPVARAIDPVIDSLTTGRMIPSGTNSPPVARAILLDHEGIIGPVVSVSITGSITLATGELLRNTDYWTDNTLGV
jgi:hypothetical protein